MKFRIKIADKIVGVVILLAVVGIVAIVIFLGANQRWFRKNFYYWSQFNSATGLSRGMSITYKGFEIGRVSKIELNELNEVVIEFYIYDDYHYLVTMDSVIELASSLLGIGGGMQFYPGRTAGPPLIEGSFIPSLDLEEGKLLVEQQRVALPKKSEDPMSSIISNVDSLVKDQLPSIILNIDSISAETEELIKNVNNAITGKGSGPIQGTLNNVNEITYKVNKIITDDLIKVIDELQMIAANIETLTADPTGLVPKLLGAKGSIATILDDENKLFNQIDKIITDLQNIVNFLRGTTPQIAGILEKSKDALDEGRDVLEALKNNPLLSGGVTEQKEQPTTFKSFRDEDF